MLALNSVEKEGLPAHLKRRIGWFLKLRIWLGIERMKEVKMLFHDWSTDPLYFQNSDRLQQIKESQVRASTSNENGPLTPSGR